ncbi:MAG: N-acetyltransferase family protein, partial [Eubacterium sp.]
AYDWAVETTIYLSQDAWGQGIGRALYHELLGLLTTQNFTRAYACITGSNTGSIAFHNAFGYKMVGRFSGCGYKHGHWEDVCWLERPLAAAQNPPLPIVPLSHMA